jgi:hypothetical protein
MRRNLLLSLLSLYPFAVFMSHFLPSFNSFIPKQLEESGIFEAGAAEFDQSGG